MRTHHLLHLARTVTEGRRNTHIIHKNEIIVIEGKEMVPPVDLVYLEKIIKNISNRNFSLKLISVDAECFKLSVDMYFDHKRSLVACTGRVNCNICVKNRRENHH